MSSMVAFFCHSGPVLHQKPPPRTSFRDLTFPRREQDKTHSFGTLNTGEGTYCYFSIPGTRSLSWRMMSWDQDHARY